MRAGPGTNYPVIGAAKVGDRYDITARNQDGSCLQVCCVSGTSAWVSNPVVAVGGVIDSVAVAQNVPPPPTPRPAPKPAPVAVRQSGPKWSLVADATADFPGGSDHNSWYYLWTEGRNNFQWQDVQRSNETGCYRDSGGHNLEVCQYAIKADPSGDVGLQWKASRGGTYRFEWDSPWLKCSTSTRISYQLRARVRNYPSLPKSHTTLVIVPDRAAHLEPALAWRIRSQPRAADQGPRQLRLASVRRQ